MAAGDIFVTIGAIDKMTGVLTSASKRWNKVMDDFARGAANKGKEGGGRAGSFFGDAFKANLLSAGVVNAISGTVSLAQNAIGGLTSKLNEAVSAETQIISATSDVATNLKIPFEDARGVVVSMRQEIAQMAAELPGNTQVFTDIAQSISSTTARIAEGDVDRFQSLTQELTSRIGVLAASADVNGFAAGSTIERMIGGSISLTEARSLQLVERNAQFQTALQEQAVELGIDIKKWKEITTQERLQVVENALKIATPDELIEQFGDTAGGFIEGMRTKLFNPDVGIFGFLRQVSALDGRTVLDAWKGFLQEMDQLLSALTSLGGRLGIDFDPMEALINNMDRLSRMVDGIERMLDNLTLDNIRDIPAMLFDRIASAIGGTNFDLSDTLSGAINTLNRTALNELSKVDFKQISAMLGRGLVLLVSELVQTLLSIDYIAVFKLGLASMKKGLGVLFGAIDGIFQAIVKFINPKKDMLSKAVDRLFEAIRNALLLSIPGLAPVHSLLNPPTADRQQINQPLSAATQTIVNQQGGSLSGAGRTTNQVTTFNISGTSDPEAVARAVESRLEASFNRAQQQQLAV